MSLENLPAGHPDNPLTQQPTPTPTPAPVPTPDVPTPAPVPPTPTPAPTVEPEVTPTFDYEGDSVLETSIKVFEASTGVSQDSFESAIQNALQYGDPNLIDVASLTQGLDPTQSAQAVALAKAAYQEARTHIQQSTEAAYQLAGGKEKWVEASQSFNTNAPAHIRSAVGALLEQGDVKGATQLVLDTVRNFGLVNTGTPPLQGGTGVAVQGLSQAEFNAQLRELERSAGNRSFEQGEYKEKLSALMAQRNLGRSLGR